MVVLSMTLAELDREWQWLFETVTSSLDVAAKLLTENEAVVPCIPRIVAGKSVPYSFAGKIRLLFEYARGQKVLSPGLVREITLEFHRLMTWNALAELALNSSEDEDDGDNLSDEQYHLAIGMIESLLPRKIASIFLAANGRADMEQKRWLSACELEALTGISPESAKQMNISSRTDKAGKPEFDPDDVRGALSTMV
ncbi:MAG: hypothetical protein IJM59_08895 [Proteobacteria bacterium]|nr:hypothetical protein [Pseudomonadota bacterium]